MKQLLVWLILGLAGCTYNTSPEDYDMDPADYVGKKGWSATGTLTAGEGSEGTGVTLQANFETEPGNYTIQFGIVQPTVQVGEFIRAIAEITWSVEGNSVRRLVNCVNGMSVTGTAQGIKARIFDDSVSTPREFNVSMQVVKGARPSLQHPPFLYDASVDIAAGGTTVVDIPQNAGVTSVYVQVQAIGAAAPIPIDDVSVSHQSTSGTSLAGYDPRLFQWVPIAPGATTILIGNSSTDNIRVTPVWGIDG